MIPAGESGQGGPKGSQKKPSWPIVGIIAAAAILDKIKRMYQDWRKAAPKKEKKKEKEDGAR
jgi:predicted ATP-grasp superfamily ATP-dependent carboligase